MNRTQFLTAKKQLGQAVVLVALMIIVIFGAVAASIVSLFRY